MSFCKTRLLIFVFVSILFTVGVRAQTDNTVLVQSIPINSLEVPEGIRNVKVDISVENLVILDFESKASFLIGRCDQNSLSFNEIQVCVDMAFQDDLTDNYKVGILTFQSEQEKSGSLNIVLTYTTDNGDDSVYQSFMKFGEDIVTDSNNVVDRNTILVVLILLVIIVVAFVYRDKMALKHKVALLSLMLVTLTLLFNNRHPFSVLPETGTVYSPIINSAIPECNTQTGSIEMEIYFHNGLYTSASNFWVDISRSSSFPVSTTYPSYHKHIWTPCEACTTSSPEGFTHVLNSSNYLGTFTPGGTYYLRVLQTNTNKYSTVTAVTMPQCQALPKPTIKLYTPYCDTVNGGVIISIEASVGAGNPQSQLYVDLSTDPSFPMTQSSFTYHALTPVTLKKSVRAPTAFTQVITSTKLSRLNTNTTYYVRALEINTGKYSEVKSFKKTGVCNISITNTPIPASTSTPTPKPTSTPKPTNTPSPSIPVPPTAKLKCDIIRSSNECKAAINMIKAAVPELLRWYPNKAITCNIVNADENFCLSNYDNGTITCPKKNWVQTKLIFHELIHQYRAQILTLPGGTQLKTSELQASLMEDEYFENEPACYGAVYWFEGKDNGWRDSSVLLNSLKSAGISHDELWYFALGVYDSLEPYVGQINSQFTRTSDLYKKGYCIGLRCNKGSEVREEIAEELAPKIVQGITCGPIDVNNDGILNLYDFIEFQKAYMHYCSDEAPKTGCGGKDTNNDGKVDIIDLQYFSDNYYNVKSKCVKY